MIQVTFTLLTMRPQTPNTLTVMAPDTLLALKGLAERLGCLINWSGRAIFSGSEDAKTEISCQLCNGGVCYDARVFLVAEDATIPALAAQLKQTGFSASPEKSTPAPEKPARNPDPDPYAIEDPDKPGSVRLAAAWGED